MLNRILEYIKGKYAVAPEYLWAATPKNGALRNPCNGKWFAVLICGVSKEKLGAFKEGTVDVMNLKCDPMLTFSFVDNQRIFRGFHMNKEHWISVSLDGSVPYEQFCALVDMSYELIDAK